MTDDTVFTCSANDECHGARGGWRGTAAEFGFRRDGKRNKRCPVCRTWQARDGGVGLKAAGKNGNQNTEGRSGRDYKALRVVERWCRMGYRATRGWTTPEAVRWQWDHACSLQDVWTDRMRRLAAREDACTAARERIAARTRQESAA